MIVPKQIEQYVEAHTSPVSDDLQHLERQTYLTTTQPHMVSGSYQGKLLEFISKMVQPKTILEIGTFTGFSALCLAKGLPTDGQLHTIDVNEELMEKTKEVFLNSKYANQIFTHIGEALEIIPTIKESFDLVFIDADKSNYVNYYDLVVEKVRPGGVILADNVLWKGRVTEAQKDKKTQQIHVFNEMVQEDPRVENILLPIRDGMMWIVKK